MTVSEKAASSTSISDDMSLNVAVLGYTCIHTRAFAHVFFGSCRAEHAASDDGSSVSDEQSEATMLHHGLGCLSCRLHRA